jgi:hypothetical protein
MGVTRKNLSTPSSKFSTGGEGLLRGITFYIDAMARKGKTSEMIISLSSSTEGKA